MALVASGNLLLQSSITLSFSRLGVLSPDGCCKSFDEDRNGYVRSEGVACIILQKAKDSRRIYAKIVHAKTNVDGFKELGITYPSWRMQQRLLEEIYTECDVDPSEVCYVEAHGTGTRVGDTQEGRAIDSVFCTNRRNTPLLVGTVKSNSGHTEANAGLSGLIKCIFAMETGYIPPNLHFNKPCREIVGLMEGRMKIVTEKTPFPNTNGYMAINSFGFGGANAHVLLEWNHKVKINGGRPADDIPRLVCVSGRTNEAISTLLDPLNESLDADYVQLLHEIFKKNIDNHNHRGYALVSKSGMVLNSCETYSGVKPKLLLIFGVFGNSWRSVLEQLSKLPSFEKTIQTIQKILINKRPDLLRFLNFRSLHSSKNNYLGTVILQLGIIELLRNLNIQPDAIFGHTTGKIACAYFEGFFTLEQALLIALQEANERQSVKIFNGASYEMNFDNKESVLRSGDNGTVVLKIGFGRSSNWMNSARNSSSYLLSFTHGKEKDGLIQFLQILGILYQRGFNPQIQNLYPKINYPVSRGTPTISDKIKWHHSQNWPVRRSLCKKMMQEDQKMFEVFPNNENWIYLNGHVIDGRELFPATGYVIMTWEAFADTKRTNKENIAVVIENCRFIRATTLNEKIDFTVGIHKDLEILKLSSVEVNEGGASIVSGKIGLLENDDKVRQLSNLPSEERNRQAISMDSNDFYKELRLRGYQYKESFRLIHSCSSDAAEAYIKWTGNWVTFMDNMLQMKLLQYNTRQLFLPIGLQRIIIDPKKHLEYVNSFGENPVVPVYNYKELGLIRCGGIEISGFIGSSLSRRREISPTLEMNKFVPNETTTTLIESIRINIQIVAENIRSLKLNIVEVGLVEGATLLAPLMVEVFADIPQISGNIKVLTTEIMQIKDVTVDNYSQLSSETDCHLIVGTNILKQHNTLQDAIRALKENGFVLSREDLDFDPLKLEHVNVSGIEAITIHTTEKEKLFLVRKSAPSNETDVIEISETDGEFKWLGDLKRVIDRTKHLVLYAQNEDNNGLLGFYNCLRKEVGDTTVQCFLIYGSDAPSFDMNHSFYRKQQSKKMSVNIYKNGKWGTYRYLILQDLEVESDHSILFQTVNDDISTLKFVEGPLNSMSELPPGKTIVHVYYSAMNFKDIMFASGRLHADMNTSKRHDILSLGIEFVGRDPSGKRVMGLSPSSISPLIAVNSDELLVIPDRWSMEEAATLPVIYGTILYALLETDHLTELKKLKIINRC
ncbi:hypothetical protein WA026_011057 [Henosepilachna vigintioctopunctata]|uniref:Uncharacterized protein n=1 Tax=Henosepilachna vigintioctopunctata TaxID=420089 RepID=A0AAW1U4S0_9CUCU